MKHLILVLSIISVCGGRVSASPVIYTEQATASGTLGVASFTNALVTVKFFGDTDNVFNSDPGGFLNNIGSAIITISGLGTAIFTDQMTAFVNQNQPILGISDFTTNRLMWSTDNNPISSTYDLKSSIVIIGRGQISPGTAFPTTFGILNFSAVSFDLSGSTFTATVVPEPSSGVSMGLGLFFVAYLASRSRQSAAKF